MRGLAAGIRSLASGAGWQGRYVSLMRSRSWPRQLIIHRFNGLQQASVQQERGMLQLRNAQSMDEVFGILDGAGGHMEAIEIMQALDMLAKLADGEALDENEGILDVFLREHVRKQRPDPRGAATVLRTLAAFKKVRDDIDTLDEVVKTRTLIFTTMADAKFTSRMNDLDVGNVIWSLGVLDIERADVQPFIAPLVDRTASLIPQMAAQSVSLIAWSMGRLWSNVAPELLDLLGLLANHAYTLAQGGGPSNSFNFKPHNVEQFLIGFGNSRPSLEVLYGEDHPDRAVRMLLRPLLQHMAVHAESYSSKSLSNGMWGIAHLGYDGREDRVLLRLADDLGSRILKKWPQHSPPVPTIDYNTLFAALVKVGIVHEEVIQQIIDSLQSRLHTINIWGTASMLASIDMCLPSLEGDVRSECVELQGRLQAKARKDGLTREMIEASLSLGPQDFHLALGEM